VLSELITFAAHDGWPLEGLVYSAARNANDWAALLVHGKVMNFYTGPCRILPPHLVALGCACLAMNRRGHDLGGIRNGRESYGGAWERFGDSQSDIAGGIAELQRRGFERIILIGHSFGGIAAAAYAAAHPDDVSALALCSAGTGGHDYLVQSSKRSMLAGDRHPEIDAEARRLVAAGEGDTMIALPGWWYAITAASWVDLAHNVPLTASSACAYPGPILALRGAREPQALYPAEAIAEAAGARATLAVIADADHFYNGVEADFARAVCDWFAGAVAARDQAR
jgi:pimeloyl-ACP methyl ester carboxylesterase